MARPQTARSGRVDSRSVAGFSGPVASKRGVVPSPGGINGIMARLELYRSAAQGVGNEVRWKEPRHPCGR